ncbi:MAG: hypothetical protein BA864_09900 [Desulfuromonadales bacterium C00003093]|nr:MAG: hypothetical protein BA864_09900 [Desulfuromonadales bacterium C00003093]
MALGIVTKALAGIFMCIMVGIMAKSAMAGNFTAVLTDDAYADGLAPNSGYGRMNYLFASGATGPAYAYLKFYLGDIPATEQIVGATLNLYCFYGSRRTINLYHISDDSWDELSLKWNNRPDKGLLLDAEYVRYPFSWVHWDLFNGEAWDVATDQADGYVSLLISPPYGDIFMFSKEFADGYYEPSLTTTTTTMTAMSTPIPASCWLLASGLAVLGIPRKISGI